MSQENSADWPDEFEETDNIEDYFSKKQIRKIKKSVRQSAKGLNFGPYADVDEMFMCMAIHKKYRCEHAGPGYRKGWRRWVLRRGKK
jgi:hypothetical protein